MKRLAIITTHPIQYNAPWFKLLAERKKLKVMVFYTWSQVEKEGKYDPGFGKNVEWDIPLLDGYEYRFINNISNEPGSHHFNGIDN
ncbi:MAG TPA: glycosyltransferase family 1 protein, partial [Hanamia sp.]